MIYRFEEGYFIQKSSHVINNTMVSYKLLNIKTGEVKHFTDDCNEISDHRVSITDALPEFYEAQWIGNPDLEKMTIAMMQEVSEAFNELDWKPWKKQETNMKAYKEELADVGIFLLLCAKTAGMSLDDLLSEMIKKHIYNLDRKDHNLSRK